MIGLRVVKCVTWYNSCGFDIFSCEERTSKTGTTFSNFPSVSVFQKFGDNFELSRTYCKLGKTLWNKSPVAWYSLDFQNHKQYKTAVLNDSDFRGIVISRTRSIEFMKRWHIPFLFQLVQAEAEASSEFFSKNSRTVLDIDFIKQCKGAWPGIGSRDAVSRDAGVVTWYLWSWTRPTRNLTLTHSKDTPRSSPMHLILGGWGMSLSRTFHCKD